jgi:hypothetical protein
VIAAYASGDPIPCQGYLTGVWQAQFAGGSRCSGCASAQAQGVSEAISVAGVPWHQLRFPVEGSRRPRYSTTTSTELPGLPTTQRERDQELHSLAKLHPPRTAHGSPRAPAVGRAAPPDLRHRRPRLQGLWRTAREDRPPHRARFHPTHPRAPGTPHSPTADPLCPRRALRARRSTAADRNEELEFSSGSQARAEGLPGRLHGCRIRFPLEKVRPLGRAPRAAGSRSTPRDGWRIMHKGSVGLLCRAVRSCSGEIPARGAG